MCDPVSAMCSSQLLLHRIMTVRHILQPQWSRHPVGSHCTCRSRGTEMAVACRCHPMFAQTRDQEPRFPFYTGKVICPKSRSKVGTKRGRRAGWIATCLPVFGSQHQTQTNAHTLRKVVLRLVHSTRVSEATQEPQDQRSIVTFTF